MVFFLGLPRYFWKATVPFSGAWSTPRRADLRLRAAMGASIRGDTTGKKFWKSIGSFGFRVLGFGFTIRVYWFRVFLEILIVMLRLIRILDVKGNQCRAKASEGKVPILLSFDRRPYLHGVNWWCETFCHPASYWQVDGGSDKQSRSSLNRFVERHY